MVGEALRLELVTDRTEAGERWRELESRLGNVGLTNGWPWISTWLNNYDDVVDITFAFGVANGTDIGGALITEAVYWLRGIPVRAVHIGTAGEPTRERTTVEYNRLLVGAEHLDLFAGELVLLLKRRFRWSALRLNGFVPPHAEALMRACGRAGLRFRVEEKTCPVFDFDLASARGHAGVFAELGKNTRHSIRRSQRLFLDRFGPLRLEWAETTEQAELILSELITLHQDRWRRRGEAGAFPTERVKRYHQQLITALSLWPLGSLIVTRLAYGDTTVGCLYNFVENGRVMFYKGGIAQFGDNRLKPGLVTHALCMAECQRRSLVVETHPRSREPDAGDGERRLVRYDFLAGESRYKEQLSNSESVLIWVLGRRGAQMKMLEWLRRPFMWGRGIVKALQQWRVG
ncbi:GNAT family N-acetyltransferase [Candidatus Nephthysia bennettiae]|uniref:GNAT family N-acetyltransferase n=1 Tax=Candidatus Nephthysia bennettiae TaxID=3127016 RepID=A0A934K3H6_9BACT|nr:GNAT family N-acetyltransferase [Candidatus Dormibacteraeota bacterium]MBJ7613987.1 GNAT family N-acetyltransferase [Candidatus Dormibacteraeota bacterium]